MAIISLHYLSWLYALDFFKTPISFSFAKKKKRATTIGVLCSIFVIIFLLINFTQSDIFQKKSPYVISQTVTYPQSKPILFKENTLLYVTLADAASKNYIDPTIFTITFDIFHLEVNANAEFTVLEKYSEILRPCTLEDVYWDTSIYFELGMKNGLCLQNKTFKLRGFWDEDEVYYAKAQLFKCNNATSNNTCKSPTEINKFFSTPKFFTTKFYGATLQMNDYENPFKTKYEDIYQLVDLLVMKRINIFFKTSELTTDDGWFFSAKYTQIAFLKDTMNYDSLSRFNDDPLFQILYYASHDSLESTRRYQSISEALASISGMGNFLFVICYFVISIHTYLQTMNITLNSLYYFPNCQTTNQKDVRNQKTRRPKVELKNLNKEICFTKSIPELTSKNQTLVETKKIEIEPDSSQIQKPIKKIVNDSFILEHYSQDKISTPKEKDPPNLKIEKEIPLKDSDRMMTTSQNNEGQGHTPMNVKFCDYILYQIKRSCKCKKRHNKKDKLIRKADKLMTEELDVLTILQKIHEIEKIKLIIFNKDQLMLFNSITKPLVFIDEQDKMLSSEHGCSSAVRMSRMIRGYKSRKITQLELQQSLKTLEKQNENTQMNQRLMRLVNDKKIKNISSSLI